MRTNATILAEARKKLSKPQFRISKLTGDDEITKAQFVVTGTVSVSIASSLPPTDLYPIGGIPVLIPLTGVPADSYQTDFYWQSEQRTTLWEIWISGDPTFEYKRTSEIQVIGCTSPVIIWEKQTDFDSVEEAFACARTQYWKVKSRSSNSVWSEVASFVNEFRIS